MKKRNWKPLSNLVIQVILGRIYEPSPEDIALVQQLQSDMSKAQMDMRLQADQMNKVQ